MNLDQLFVNAHGALLGMLPEGMRPWVSFGVIIGAIAALAPLIMMYLTWIERKLIPPLPNPPSPPPLPPPPPPRPPTPPPPPFARPDRWWHHTGVSPLSPLGV